MQTIEQLKPGDIPFIGASSMCDLHTGWTEGDGSGHEGYQVADYFDRNGRYLGPDCHGVEPTFREMNEEEVAE